MNLVRSLSHMAITGLVTSNYLMINEFRDWKLFFPKLEVHKLTSVSNFMSIGQFVWLWRLYAWVDLLYRPRFLSISQFFTKSEVWTMFQIETCANDTKSLQRWSTQKGLCGGIWRNPGPGRPLTSNNEEKVDSVKRIVAMCPLDT